jgi:ADP-ribose pyrophosphatase YjhB (NUDIX family)
MVPHYLEGKLSHWYPPGGGIEFLESVEQAAIREFLEETGLEVKLVENLGYLQYREEGELSHSITFVFKGEYVSGTTRAESSLYGDKTPIWFPISELPKSTEPDFKEKIQNCSTNLTSKCSGPAKTGSLI